MATKKSVHTRRYAQFLELLIETRLSAGVTQSELAKRLGLTQSAVSKVERGERRLDAVELFAWCEALGRSFGTFAAQMAGRLASK